MAFAFDFDAYEFGPTQILRDWTKGSHLDLPDTQVPSRREQKYRAHLRYEAMGQIQRRKISYNPRSVRGSRLMDAELDIFTEAANLFPNGSLVADVQLIPPTSIEAGPVASVNTSIFDPLEIQQVLPLNIEFVPSRKLLEYWTFGLNSYLSEGLAEDHEVTQLSLRSDSRQLCKEFDRRLKDVVIKFAYMKSYEQETVRLSTAGRFLNSFMIAIFDSFLIRLDCGDKFFRLLSEELREWLMAGDVFSGSWGRLTVDAGGDFVLKTHRSSKRRIKGFKKAVAD